MVTSMLDEGSSEAATQLTTYQVQRFDASRPTNLAQPMPVRPSPEHERRDSDSIMLDVSSSTSGNQTDDEKAKDSIAQFVNNLVQNAVQTARDTTADGRTSQPTRRLRRQVYGASYLSSQRRSIGESLTDDIKQAVADGVGPGAFSSFLSTEASSSSYVRTRRSQSLSPREVKNRGHHSSSRASLGSSPMPSINQSEQRTTYSSFQSPSQSEHRTSSVLSFSESPSTIQRESKPPGVSTFADSMVSSIMSTAQGIPLSSHPRRSSTQSTSSSGKTSLYIFL